MNDVLQTKSKLERCIHTCIMLIPVCMTILFFGFVLWPVESQIPFDSKAWIENATPPTIGVRTRMKDDLVARLKTERWSSARLKQELGASTNSDNPQSIIYELGHRRGMWPFHSWGAMTGFDSWHLRINLDANGIVQDAYAHPD